jgi:hypothetical protein
MRSFARRETRDAEATNRSYGAEPRAGWGPVALQLAGMTGSAGVLAPGAALQGGVGSDDTGRQGGSRVCVGSEAGTLQEVAPCFAAECFR